MKGYHVFLLVFNLFEVSVWFLEDCESHRLKSLDYQWSCSLLRVSAKEDSYSKEPSPLGTEVSVTIYILEEEYSLAQNEGGPPIYAYVYISIYNELFISSFKKWNDCTIHFSLKNYVLRLTRQIRIVISEKWIDSVIRHVWDMGLKRIIENFFCRSFQDILIWVCT